jgi:CcmD family protein
MKTTLWTLALAVFALAAGVSAQTPDAFTTMKQPVETIPAAPMVFIAYAFVWAALLLYVLQLWRRIGRIERELADLNGRLRAGRRT